MNNNLDRFLIAQQTYYRTALEEIRSGQKRSHWMWFIFPQIAGLGHSETARYYAVQDMDEAKVFFVKYFSLKKASEFPVFVKGISLLSAGHNYASLRMRACSIR